MRRLLNNVVQVSLRDTVVPCVTRSRQNWRATIIRPCGTARTWCWLRPPDTIIIGPSGPVDFMDAFSSCSVRSIQ
jgi:hypothetical protein